MKFIDIINEFWRDASMPSPPDESVYQFVVIAVGHIFIGSLLGVFLTGLWLFLIPIAYFALKELSDIKRGGTLIDSIVDMLFVGVGAIYLLVSPWGPVIALAVLFMVTWAKYTKKINHGVSLV